MNLVDAFNGYPHEDVGGAGAGIVGVAVDATFGDVDEAATFDGEGEAATGAVGGCDMTTKAMRSRRRRGRAGGDDGGRV